MRTWLKRMVAGIVSAGTLMGGGLLMAGTANADEIRMPDIGKTITSPAASNATTYPRELVNGGFDYLPAGGWNAISPKLNTSRGKFTSVDPVNGQYIRNAYVTDGNAAWVKWNGFDASKFGWISDQKGGKPQGFVTDHANSVELQRDNGTGNTYAEIVGSEIGKSIYQKIDTRNSTDAVYTVRFDHAALSSEHADGMQALVNGKPVTMTRIGGNKAGDKTGWTGTDIVTHATNTDHYRHDGQWATYEGKVTIPANTPVSTFTFKSLNEAKPDMGNLIDNLTFKIAYRLSYDSNGGTKAKASQISSRTEGKASETDGKVKTVADDAAGRVVLECKRSGEGATGPYADKFCWIDWSNLPLNRTGEPIPVRINVPGGHIDADATVAHTDNAALTAKDFTGNKWSRLIPAYRLTGNTALAFTHIQGNSADPLASVMFSNITPVANQTATSVNVLKDFQLAFGDAETMSGYVVNDKKIYEQTDIESDKTLDKLGMIGDNNPNQSYSEANTGYGTTHVTLAGGPAGAHALTEEADSKGAAVIGATRPTRFKVSFKQVNHPADDSWSAIAIGVYMPYLTAHPLTYDKNGQSATGSVPSNENADAVKQAKSKTNGSVRLASDDKNGLPDHLVNGTFDYRGNEIINENQRVYGDTTYLAIISAKTGIIDNPLHSKLDNWDSGKFGWRSNDDTAGADTVEVQRRNHTPYPTNAGNVWGEIAAAKRGKYIYQDIATTPGVVYKWSLKHASRNADQDDSMQVMIGEPSKTVAQQATRTTSNGSDKTGSVGTTITTHGTAQDGKWETYTGDYLATSTTTRFTFRSVRDSNGQGLDFTAEGNCVDDLSFDKAYKLSYDKNSSDATGSVPSNQYGKENTVQPAKSKTTGSVGLAADKTASGLTVHDLKKNDKGKVPSSSKADSTQPAAFKAPDAKVETIASRAAGDELAVNGGFDTPKWTIAKEGQGLPWVYVTPNAGMIRSYAQAMAGQTGVKAGGLTAATFAWQDLDAIGSIQNFELHREKDGNTAADVHAGRTVAQTVNTTPGASYTFSIRHSGRSKGNAGGVTLLTGPDKDHLTPVRLTRTTVSKTGAKYGDKIGDVGTVAYTHSDSTDATEGSHDPWDHSDDWESYEGTVVIPAGQTRTMIAYKGAGWDGTDAKTDSIIDDLSFRLSYRLGYDANGGTGQVPSRTETGRTETAASGTDGTVRLAADKSAEPESGTIADDRRVLTDTTARQDDGTSQRTITRSDGSVRVETIATTGAVSGCQVYYPAGTRITLATAKADSDCWDSSQIGKTSRTFYGWSANTDANDRDVPVGDTMDRNTLNANVRTEIVMPARAKTVYALWAINPTLSYNVNTPAGSNAPVTPASRTVPYNTAAPDTSGWQTGDTGKIPGYRFDGWYTAPNGGNKYDFNTPLTNNVTVYAHWVGNGYTVRFAGNGATGGDTPDQAFQYNIGQNLRRNGFVRDGYTFTGWKRADNQQAYGDGQWVTNLTTQPNGIVTMVAQWSANEAHIRYNPNPPAGKTTGGQGTPNWDGHTGDTPTIGQNGWTIDGYTFAGWATSPDGSGARYAPGARWTANGTLTLYAQWTPGQASLTYDGNGATGGKTDPQNGVTDQRVNVRRNGFTRDGYVFTGWNTQPDGRGQAWAPDAVWTLHGTGVLYARWRGNQQRLNYHGNGNTGGNTESQDGRTGDVLDTRANGFTRDGYEFVEWNTRADGTGDHYGKGTNGVAKWTMLPAGNDLYAIWQANPASIQYRDDWGATGSTPDTTGVTGQDVTIARNGFTRPGYTFTGWARDRRTNPSLQPGGRYTLTPGTTTLWAQWKADPAHLIYNSNSGSSSQTRRTDGVVDQTLTVIANPFTRPGYTFTGWNTQADGRGRAYTAGNGFRLAADPKSNPVNTSVLYAQWRINRVTLKFNPNGGTGGYPDITVDAFTTVTIPADAKEPKVQRPGFRFTGWAMKPTPGSGDTILSPGKGTVSMPDRGSITVYAQWAPAMTTLPFTGGHAQVPTIGLYAGLAFMILAMGALMPVIRLRMAAARRGRHAGGTGTAGRHAR
ncbi:hypothetical protein MCC01966_10550 [Bifidobacteriaceae bacterium MCC01966]|nr:hypothetical protein MCC01966_10550 [Bifidobacteriaceae bacterium MCC01966]